MVREGLCHGEIPGCLALGEGVAEHQELAHAGDESHLGWLTGAPQPLLAGPQAGIEPRGGQFTARRGRGPTRSNSFGGPR